MSVVIIGSTALNNWARVRVPRDLDVVGTYDGVMEYIKQFPIPKSIVPIEHGNKLIIKTDYRIIEAELAWPGSSNEMLLNLVGKQDQPVIAPLDMLYTIKMSHRYKKNSPHFKKTLDDILYMRSLGAKIPDEYQEFYALRQKESYDYSHPKLNVTKKDFFNGDSIPYVYDHDSIHEVVVMAPNRRPAYKQYMVEGAEVQCSREKFEACSRNIQLRGVLEEAYVLALERSQIPFKGQVAPRTSFLIALSKVCTSITSGWFREFAWENYYPVVALYTDYYVEKFWKAVASGKVKPYKA